MSMKNSPDSNVDSSSPESNHSAYITPSFLHGISRDDKNWRSYFSTSEVPSSSAIMSHIHNVDDNLGGPLGFLYDYYGEAEETHQEPPSPGRRSG